MRHTQITSIVKRRLYNFVTAGSLVLACSTLVLWGRGYYVVDALSKTTSWRDDAGTKHETSWRVETWYGGVRFNHVRSIGGFPLSLTNQPFHYDARAIASPSYPYWLANNAALEFLGFQIAVDDWADTGIPPKRTHDAGLVFPLWFVVTVFAALPALRLLPWLWRICQHRLHHRAGFQVLSNQNTHVPDR